VARLTGFEDVVVDGGFEDVVVDGDFEDVVVDGGFGRVALAGRSGAFVGCVNRRGVLASVLEMSSSAFRLTETLGIR
jgi:hypothetical protein